SSAMACGTDGCLLLYTREIAFADPQTFLYGTRIGDDGALLDEPRLFFGEATSIVSIVARDDDYLALWTIAGDGGDEARVGRFDLDTGQLVEDLTFVLPAGINHSFHRGQSTLLILYENTGAWYTQLLDLGALEP